MKGPIKERWQELCEQAAIEQDPQRMIELVEEINRILTEKEQRLNTHVALLRTIAHSRRAAFSQWRKGTTAARGLLWLSPLS